MSVTPDIIKKEPAHAAAERIPKPANKPVGHVFWEPADAIIRSTRSTSNPPAVRDKG